MGLICVDCTLDLCGRRGACSVPDDIADRVQTMKDMFLSPKMTPCRLARYSLVCALTLAL